MATLGNLRQLGEGNTISSPQPSRKTFYALTFHNIELETVIRQRFIEIGKKGIIGREICPTTNKKHLQAFIALKKPMRWTELKFPGNPHVEPCRGSSEQNEIYCKKEGDYWSFGFPKAITIIENLHPWQKSIEDIFFTPPNDRTIHWFWETTGNIGKSAFVKYMVVKHKVLFCCGGKYADIMNLVFNNDMDECTCIIFDIPRANAGKVSYASLESIKNGLVCNTKYETGVKAFNSPHVFVFANSVPENPELLSRDRWDITEIC